MPVPTSINDLSTTASANYPSGTDSPAVLDNVQQAHASFIAQLRDQAFGSGQTWQNVLGSRSANTNYTNSTSRPIVVAASAVNTVNGAQTVNAVVSSLTVAGLTSVVSTGAGTQDIGVSAVVPPGATYSIATSNATLNRWSELR